MPLFSYAFGGLHIQSDFYLAGLMQLPEAGNGLPADIRIVLAHGHPPKADPVFSWPGRYGLQLAIAGEQNLFLSARDGSFLVNSRADTIHCFPAAGAAFSPASEGMCQLLMRRVLPRITQLHGRSCLHAASVMVNAKEAILLLAPSGAGKSTLAAALKCELGWQVLSDDISIIDSTVLPARCFPVVSGACLWPDSLASCDATSLSSHCLPAHDEKCWCAFDGDAPAFMATVRALLFIDRETGCGKEPELRQMTPAVALMSAMRQVVRFNPADTSTVKSSLDSLGSMLQNIPAYNLSYVRSYAALPEVAACLRAYFESAQFSNNFLRVEQ